jgi:hypothetical protein
MRDEGYALHTIGNTPYRRKHSMPLETLHTSGNTPYHWQHSTPLKNTPYQWKLITCEYNMNSHPSQCPLTPSYCSLPVATKHKPTTQPPPTLVFHATSASAAPPQARTPPGKIKIPPWKEIGPCTAQQRPAQTGLYTTPHPKGREIENLRPPPTNPPPFFPPHQPHLTTPHQLGQNGKTRGNPREHKKPPPQEKPAMASANN